MFQLWITYCDQRRIAVVAGVTFSASQQISVSSSSLTTSFSSSLVLLATGDIWDRHTPWTWRIRKVSLTPNLYSIASMANPCFYRSYSGKEKELLWFDSSRRSHTRSTYPIGRVACQDLCRDCQRACLCCREQEGCQLEWLEASDRAQKQAYLFTKVGGYHFCYSWSTSYSFITKAQGKTHPYCLWCK